MGSNLILLIEVCVVHSLLVISVKFGPFLLEEKRANPATEELVPAATLMTELTESCQLYVTCFDYLTAARPLAV